MVTHNSVHLLARTDALELLEDQQYVKSVMLMVACVSVMRPSASGTHAVTGALYWSCAHRENVRAA